MKKSLSIFMSLLTCMSAVGSISHMSMSAVKAGDVNNADVISVYEKKVHQGVRLERTLEAERRNKALEQRMMGEEKIKKNLEKQQAKAERRDKALEQRKKKEEIFRREMESQPTEVKVLGYKREKKMKKLLEESQRYREIFESRQKRGAERRKTLDKRNVREKKF